MKRELSDIACELDGISAIASYLSMDFLENCNRASDNVIGECLFAISQYADRISDDLTDIESIMLKETLQKESA